MKKHLLLVFLLLAASLPGALAQTRVKSKAKMKSEAEAKAKAAKAKAKTSVSAPIIIKKDEDSGPADDKPPVVVRKMKIKSPVLVYYEQAPPGKVTQQLIMDEEHLALLRYLTPDQLVSRREVFVDGLGNLGLPGTDETKYRLLGSSAIAENERRPAGDGRSTYSRLKVPSPGDLYMVRESAEEYRHFVKGSQKQGSLLDFQVNGLPGVDSVRAVYTLRRMDSAERGAGSGSTIR